MSRYNAFSIRGIRRETNLRSCPLQNCKRFKKAFLDICTMSTAAQSATSAVKFPPLLACCGWTFTQVDIDKLEREGQALRSDWERSPMSHTLPQVLRTVGWYVDQKNCELQKISRTGETLTVSYTGSLGTHKLETLTLVEIYDMWVHLY